MHLSKEKLYFREPKEEGECDSRMQLLNSINKQQWSQNGKQIFILSDIAKA